MVNSLDFSSMLLNPASFTTSKDALIAAIDRMGGLLNCQPSAPVPLYNSFEDVFRMVEKLKEILN